MQKITTFLWFDNNAEEAVNFYLSVFKNSKITEVTYYQEGSRMPKGTVMTIAFSLDGVEFTALNGGPEYSFSPAVSFSVLCKTQEEIDEYWEKLTSGGEEIQCGWLKDKFGLSWQIVPDSISNLVQNPDPEKSKKIMSALYKMKKIDIKTLEMAGSED